MKECCLWLLDAKWKQKRNTDKVMVSLSEFGIRKEELIARNLIKPLPPQPTSDLIEKLRKAVVLTPANHIQMDPDGDLIVIQGQLHFYRLFRSTGRMERVSDNFVLDLNWPAIPDTSECFSIAYAIRRSSLPFVLTCSCRIRSSKTIL